MKMWLNLTRLLNVEYVPSGERSVHPSSRRGPHLPQGQSDQLVMPAAVGLFRHQSGPPDGAATDDVGATGPTCRRPVRCLGFHRDPGSNRLLERSNQCKENNELARTSSRRAML